MASIIPYIDEQTIVGAITQAEKNTSGEIRVHIEDRIEKSLLDDAAIVFENLNMHLTKNRNGVLVFIADQDKKLCIIGDAGINAVIDEGYWDQEVSKMQQYFQDNSFTQGIVSAIQSIGKTLAKHFPFEDGTRGELPNNISYG